MSCRHSNKQQGAALVIALLVFALAAALMVGVQRDFNLQLQRSTNTFFAEQGWSFLLGAETLAELALRLDVDEDAKSDTPVDSLQELWAQPQAPYPIDGIGFLSGDIYDLQGYFNINSLVDQSNNQGRDPNTPLGEAPAQPVGETGETRRFNAEQRVLLRLLLAIEEAERVAVKQRASLSELPTLSTLIATHALRALRMSAISFGVSLPCSQSATG